MTVPRSRNLPVAAIQTRPSTADAAVWYVEHGLAIYPARGKRRIKGYNSDCAIRHAKDARKCFEREHPNANIGIVCGPSRLVVVDCDVRNGGWDSMDVLCLQIGYDWFRDCLWVLTPGGFHMYFRTSEQRIPKSGTILGPGLDLLSGDSGVIAPPSTRPEGTYRWVGGFPKSFSPPPFPAVLLKRISAKTPNRKPNPHLPRETSSVIPVGLRNMTLTSLAGSLLRSIGPISEQELLDHLRLINERRCRPPSPEDEVRTIAHSVSSYGGPSVDPLRWLRAAQSRLRTRGEFLTAWAYAEIAAKCGRSQITPSELYVCRGWGIPRTTYFRAKTALEQKGCIHITDQRPDAPLIELAAEIV